MSNDNTVSEQIDNFNIDLESFFKTNYDNLLSVFGCPLTCYIMFDPVVANDGNIYERDAIEILCNNSTSAVSPITRQPLNNKFRSIPLFNDLIKLFIKYGKKIDPEITEMIHTPSFEFEDNKESIYNYLQDSNSYSRLLKFKNYKLNDTNNGQNFIYQLMIKSVDFQVIKYVLENCVDLNFITQYGETIVHYACSYSIPSVINYIIDNSEEQKFDLDKETVDKKHRPFTLLLENPNSRDFNIQKKFLNNMKDTSYKTLDNMSLFHNVCSHGTEQLIRHFIDDKNADLLEKGGEDQTIPIVQIIKRQQFWDTIKYILDKLDTETLELEDIRCGSRLSHYLCDFFIGMPNSKEVMKFVFDKLDVSAVTNTLDTPISIIFSKGRTSDIKYCIDNCPNITDYFGKVSGEDSRLPIYSIIEKSNDNQLIKSIIDKIYESDPNILETATSRGWKLSHFLCRYKSNNLEIMKYLLNKGLDMEAVTNDGWTPFHFICYYGSYDTVAYVMGMGINLETPINRFFDKDASYIPINMIELNKNISNDTKETLINEIIQYIQIIKMTMGL